MIVAATITVAAGLALIAIIALLAETVRSGWGRVFDRELIAFARGSSWLAGDDTCEVLYAELLQRSDKLAAWRTS